MEEGKALRRLTFRDKMATIKYWISSISDDVAHCQQCCPIINFMPPSLKLSVALFKSPIKPKQKFACTFNTRSHYYLGMVTVVKSASIKLIEEEKLSDQEILAEVLQSISD